MNELKPLADKMEIDLYEVIQAAATNLLVCSILSGQSWEDTVFQLILFI